MDDSEGGSESGQFMGQLDEWIEDEQYNNRSGGVHYAKNII